MSISGKTPGGAIVKERRPYFSSGRKPSPPLWAVDDVGIVQDSSQILMALPLGYGWWLCLSGLERPDARHSTGADPANHRQPVQSGRKPFRFLSVPAIRRLHGHSGGLQSRVSVLDAHPDDRPLAQRGIRPAQ